MMDLEQALKYIEDLEARIAAQELLLQEYKYNKAALEHLAKRAEQTKIELRAKIKKIALLWPGHKDCTFTESETINILLLIEDAVRGDLNFKT